MKLAIALYTADPETAWNAFRLGNFALGQGDQVKVFLLAKGVECDALDSEQFKVKAQMQGFVDQGGEILACGTCLKLRHSAGSELCPLSTMQDLYELVRDADKVVTF
jgi:uncharacterized protein involved in oxidation of intracellular sulfur